MQNEQQTQQPNEVNITPNVASSGKAKILVPIVICAILALLIVGGVVFKVTTSAPKNVFKSTINNGYKYIDNTLDDSQEYYDMFNIQKDAITLSADVKANVELEDADSDDAEVLKLIKDMKISGKVGVDVSNKEIMAEGDLSGKKETVNIKVFVQDNDMYVDSNLFEKPVKLSADEIGDSLDIDWDEISKTLEEATKDIDTNPETYKDITKAFKDALVKALDSEYMSKEKDEIEVDGKDIKVTKYSYELKEKAVKGIVEDMAENLLDNDDFISKTAKAIGKDKKDIKELLKNLKKSSKDIKIDKDDVIIINVYTRGLLNKFAGLSIEADKEEVIKYTTDGKNKELVFESDDDKAVVTVNAKGKDSYKVEVKYNKEKIATLDVKEYNEEKIDLDYEVNYKDEKFEGSLYLSLDKGKSKLSGDYKVSFKYEKNSIAVEGSYEIESSSKLDSIDTKSAISSKELDSTKIESKYNEIKKNDPSLGKILDALLESDAIEPVTPDTPVTPTTSEKDYYGFYTVGYDEGAIKSLLTKTEATVVYVGTEYYSGDQAKTFESLKTLHNEMNFTSYYLPYYRASYDEDYLAAVKGITPVCAETGKTCEEFPSVLLVRNGKVEKVLRGNYSKDALKKALTDFGIN